MIFRVYAPRLINSSECTIHAERIAYGGENDGYIEYIEIEAEQIGDEYHTMHELYNHRMALTVALTATIARGCDGWSIKSKLHSDGTMFDGYFVVVIVFGFADEKPEQVSYHYELKYWDSFNIPEVERAPEYDGHTSKDVIERLMRL